MLLFSWDLEGFSCYFGLEFMYDSKNVAAANRIFYHTVTTQGEQFWSDWQSVYVDLYFKKENFLKSDRNKTICCLSLRQEFETSVVGV